MISLLFLFPSVHPNASRLVGPLVLVSLLIALSSVRAQVAEDKSAEFTTEIVLTGLDNPWGLAIRGARDRAGPHEVFIAESGAGRVIRVSTDEPHNAYDVVTGFEVGEADTLPNVRTGPLGLAFLTRTKLIVTGSSPDKESQGVRVFVLSGDNRVMTAGQADHVVEPSSANFQQGMLWGIATTPTAAYVTSALGQEGKAVLKADHKANRLDSLRPLVVAKAGNQLNGPMGVAVTPTDRPQFLVVGDMGSIDAGDSSRLLFYTLQGAEPALQLRTGLPDISGLAYSPTGQLYAISCAWDEPGRGGVFRLDDARIEGQQACRAVKIAAVTRGVALAFAPDGALYVTSLGAGDRPKQGSLIKIIGNF